jgi:hypothetical protein
VNTTIANQAGIFVVHLSQAQNPQYQEKKGAGGGYIEFGAANDYPDYLLRLFDASPKHGAIIRGKVTYVGGQGWMAADKGADADNAAEAFIKQANPDESLKSITDKIAFDLETFEGAYLNIVWSRSGKKITAIYHIPYTRVRTNKDNTMFWYKEDWIDSRKKPVVIPAFNPALRSRSQVLMIKPYTPGQCAYPKPSYFACLNYLEADAEVSRHVLSNAKTGFTGTTHITFFTESDLSEEGTRELKRKVVREFTGGDGAKIVVAVADNPDHAPRIDKLGTSDLTNENFGPINDLIQAEIYAGHQVPSSSIFGVATPGKLGATTEMRDAYEIFNKTYVVKRHATIEQAINMIAVHMGISALLSIIPVDLLSILDAADAAAVMTDDEKREKLGLPALPKPALTAGQKLAEDISKLSPGAAAKVLDTLTGSELRSLVGLPSMPEPEQSAGSGQN